MYIKKDIPFKLRNDLAIFHEGDFESIFNETIHPNANSVIVGEIYRTPNTNAAQSVKRYYEIISKLDGSMPIIIGTDQNFDLLKIENNPNTEELLNTYLTASIVPTITKPTRITNTTATLIDNIYVKYLTNVKISSGIILSDISDHLPVFVS
jgi:hypothetical protein